MWKCFLNILRVENFSEAIYYGLSIWERFISIYLFLYFLINYILFSVYLEQLLLQIYVMLHLLLSNAGNHDGRAWHK